jgi:hypothetical protein
MFSRRTFLADSGRLNQSPDRVKSVRESSKTQNKKILVK